MDEEAIGPGKARRVQWRAKRTGWTKKRREDFLEHLALTCSVIRAAAAVGGSASGAYRLRIADAAFADGWRRAIETGYDRLEALVLEHGGAGVPLEVDDSGAAPPDFNFDRAIQVLRFYRGQRDGVPSGRSGRKRRNATREETNAALLKALKAAEKRLARQADER